ncbi:hypothetical protein B0H14DRAFT_3482659 [Mycena olivaceomarginata]|nr:hypothetical protein B0H14DRAFT_3482659 [Mycena olivaceomarginata]
MSTRRKTRVKHIRGRHLEIVSGPGSASTSVSTHTFSGDVFMADAPLRPINTYVDRVSEDSRRIYREVVPIEPPSPVKNARVAEAHQHLDVLSAPRKLGGTMTNPDTSQEHYEMFHDNTVRLRGRRSTSDGAAQVPAPA